MVLCCRVVPLSPCDCVVAFLGFVMVVCLCCRCLVVVVVVVVFVVVVIASSRCRRRRRRRGAALLFCLASSWLCCCFAWRCHSGALILFSLSSFFYAFALTGSVVVFVVLVDRELSSACAISSQHSSEAVALTAIRHHFCEDCPHRCRRSLSHLAVVTPGGVPPGLAFFNLCDGETRDKRTTTMTTTTRNRLGEIVSYMYEVT
jgi:hypothetical protein